MIALILVIGDIIRPLDVRIVSKQGQGLKTKPEIYKEMVETAQARFAKEHFHDLIPDNYNLDKALA